MCNTKYHEYPVLLHVVMSITILQVTNRVMTVWRWRWPCQRCPCPETQLVVCPAGRAARRSVAECRGIPRPTTSQPLREQEQIRAAQRPSQGVSNRAPQTCSQSEDRIICVRRGCASQAGFTRAYLRNAATDWSYGIDLLDRIPLEFCMA